MPYKGLPLVSEDDFAQRFLIVRGRSVQTYAEFEQSLGSLYAFLMGVSPDIAGVTFFKINQGRIRSVILDNLLRKKFGTTYSTFWNPLVKLFGELNEKRNQIVHWATVMVIEVKDQSQTEEVFLMPPNVWDSRLDQKIGGQDLCDFIVKCDFIARTVNIFTAVLSRPPEEVSDTWRQICQQPVVYPPPDNHPLSQKQSVP